MKVLVVVDCQNDFIDGVLGSKEAQEAVPNIIEKLKNVNEDTCVIFTRDTHWDAHYLDTLEGKMLPVKHCIFNTPGWEINEKIAVALPNGIGRAALDKETFGSMDLMDLIREFEEEYWDQTGSETTLDEIELIGFCTDICVISNALALRMARPNTRIRVDKSCCAGTTIMNHLSALDVMKSCQIEVY